MAASYQTGISSSPTNLLQTLVTWLTNQGWTMDMSQAVGAGWRAHLHKSGIYVNLRSAMNEKIWHKATGDWDRAQGYGIGLYLGTGHNGGASWVEQAGRPLRTDVPPSTSGCGMNLPAGSVAGYHFFDDGLDNVIVVVERSPGVFVHMGWGLRLVDMGAPEDFLYFFASSSAFRNTDPDPGRSLPGVNQTARAPFARLPHENQYDYEADAGGLVRVDTATFSGRWVADCTGDDAEDGYTGRFMDGPLNENAYGTTTQQQHPDYALYIGRTTQTAFAGTLLLPMHLFVLTDPGARWAPLGYPPNLFWCEGVGAGYAAGEILQVGGLDYMLFPNFAVRKAA